ncbi:MAG: NUDIX domain-containing protein [Parcubacteria group bacterium]
MSELERKITQAVLVFPIYEDRVLMAWKMRRIAQGFWNGYGGRIKKGETPLEAAVREPYEEGKITTSEARLRKVAIIDFINVALDGSESVWRVHVFILRGWNGMPEPSEEMINPTWFWRNSLPLLDMAPADRFWLPRVLRGRRFFAEAHLGDNQRRLIGKVVFKKVPKDKALLFAV